MESWKDTVISVTDSVRRALEVIDAAAVQVALVLEGDGRLAGIVGDGDIRRALLRGMTLDDPVTSIMNPNPLTVPSSMDAEAVMDLMVKRVVRQIPVVDDNGRLTGLRLLNDFLEPARRPNPVVIMAGGIGSRLRPYTETCPKPMLKVGGKPMLETIMQGFARHGFQQFILCVNYKPEMIKDHFGDGSEFGFDIEYVHENEKMGTAGALSLLADVPAEPFFVINGDILTKVNYVNILDAHAESGGVATMGVREYEVQVPFGVIEPAAQSHRIKRIVEKPVYRSLINAGVYMLSPEALEYVPRGQFFDMPELFNRLIDAGRPVDTFLIHEYWIDVGHQEQFIAANEEYLEVFT